MNETVALIFGLSMLYILGSIVTFAITEDQNKYNTSIAIIWPIILLILLAKCIIKAFKEIPKIWKT